MLFFFFPKIIIKIYKFLDVKKKKKTKQAFFAVTTVIGPADLLPCSAAAWQMMSYLFRLQKLPV